MFRCLYIILRESRIMYTKVTKLIKWKHLYRWLLWKISRLKPLKCCKMCQVVCSSWSASFITVHRTLLCGWWLYIQSLESGIVFLVGSSPSSTSSCVKVVPHTGRYTNRDWAHKKKKSKLYWFYVQPPTTKQCSKYCNKTKNFKNYRQPDTFYNILKVLIYWFSVSVTCIKVSISLIL